MEYEDAAISQGHAYDRAVKYVATLVRDQRDVGFSTQEVVHGDITGVFDNFYIPFLSFFENQLRESIPSLLQDPVQIETDKVVNAAVAMLRFRLMAIASKVLITEIHLRKKANKLGGSNGIERYEDFNAKMLLIPYQLSILNKYPVLSYLLYTTIFSALSWVRGIIGDFCRDYPRIKEKFMLNSSGIEKLELGLGDPHNNGKAVSIVVMVGGERLVYKPHATAPESIYIKLVDWVNCSGQLKTQISYAKTLAGEGYGWHEYIEARPCRDNQEAKRFFYRSGALLALLHICRAVDIHGENLIACGEHPVVIDLETLFSNVNPVLYGENMMTIFLRQVNDSALGTMLLPQNFSFSTFDLDISALSGDSGEESRRIRVNSVVNRGTDDIRIKEVFYVTEGHGNRATLGGEKLAPAKYYKEIEEGFTDCYKLVCRVKPEFIKLISSFSTIKFRQIVKPTHIYYKFIEAGYHPKYMTSFEARYRLFSILYGEDEEKNKHSPVGQAEIEALFSNNIPYFAADFGSGNLYTDSGQCITSYFKRPLLEILAKRIEGLSRNSLQRQLDYIRMSLVTTENNIWGGDHGGETINIRQHEIFKPGESFLHSACRIGDYLEQTAIYGPDTSICTWLTLVIAKESGFEMNAVNYSIYEGGGLVLFLACLGKETGDSKYSHLARAALKGIEFLYHPQRADTLLPMSAYWGTGSLVYLYYNLSVLWNDSELYEKYKEALTKLINLEVSEEEPLDYLGGLAGVVTLLVNIYREERDEALLKQACRYGRLLYQRSKNNGEMLTGLSHGYAGVSLALIALGRIAKIDRYFNWGRQLIVKENTYYSHTTENWLDLRQIQESEAGIAYWCHGAAGIGLARALVADFIDEEEALAQELKRDIEAAVAKTFKFGFAGDGNSLCHGHFGNLDILLKIASLQNNRTGLKDRIIKEAREVMERNCIHGMPYQPLGFMLGLTGIGYVLLRLVNNNYPSVLALDVAKGTVCEGDLHV